MTGALENAARMIESYRDQVMEFTSADHLRSEEWSTTRIVYSQFTTLVVSPAVRGPVTRRRACVPGVQRNRFHPRAQPYWEDGN